MGLDTEKINHFFSNIYLVSMITFVLVYLWDYPPVFSRARRYLGMLSSCILEHVVPNWSYKRIVWELGSSAELPHKL